MLWSWGFLGRSTNFHFSLSQPKCSQEASVWQSIPPWILGIFMIAFGYFPHWTFPCAIVAVQTYFEDYFSIALFWFSPTSDLHREEVFEILHEQTNSSRKATIAKLCSAFSGIGNIFWFLFISFTFTVFWQRWKSYFSVVSDWPRIIRWSWDGGQGGKYDEALMGAAHLVVGGIFPFPMPAGDALRDWQNRGQGLPAH